MSLETLLQCPVVSCHVPLKDRIFLHENAFLLRKMHGLSVLKRCVPKTLAFAFGLRLRSKTRCFKMRVLGRRLPNGKPQERLRFRALRSKTLAFKKNHCDHFLRFKDFPRSQGLRLGPLRSKNAAFCVCVLKPTKCMGWEIGNTFFCRKAYCSEVCLGDSES